MSSEAEADNNPEPVITFSDKDLEGIEVPHNDELVVTMTVAKTTVDKVLVDTGSSVNILSLSALKTLGLSLNTTKQTRVFGAYGGKSKSAGKISLPVTAGTEPRSTTAVIDFLVLEDYPSVNYDVVLGRPGLQALRAVSSTYHLLLRFPTKAGIGEVRGNQLLARKCFCNKFQRLHGKTKGKKGLHGSRTTKLFEGYSSNILPFILGSSVALCLKYAFYS